MSTRKTEPNGSLRRRPVQIESEGKSRDAVEIMHSRLKAAEPLALDDSDFGTDPYNSTGRFSTLNSDR